MYTISFAVYFCSQILFIVHVLVQIVVHINFHGYPPSDGVCYRHAQMIFVD